MKKKKLDKSKCPEFDYFNYEPILKWAGARVVWDDTFVSGRGKRTKRPEDALWTLLWDHGFIGFDCINEKKDRKKARMAGAMFIYLWCKGVPASICDNLASLYARKVIMYRH